VNTARPATAAACRAALLDARARVLALLDDLDDCDLVVPRLPTVNPLLWELGHVAWFQQRWTLRHLGNRQPLYLGEDALWDSAAVAHDRRWDLPLPGREATFAYAQGVLDAVLERLDRVPFDEREAHFHTLVLLHEDMHAEAFLYMRQALALPEPAVQGGGLAAADVPPAPRGDVELAGGRVRIGMPAGEAFVFDNEQDAHDVELAPFRLARAKVTQAEFAAFVDDGGYAREELWSAEGLAWRRERAAAMPVYWRRAEEGRYERRHFDRWVALEPALPVCCVSWFEAEAYCRWAGRRLPSEAEWEAAARHAGGGAPRTWPWGDAPPDAGRADLDQVRTWCSAESAFARGATPAGIVGMVGGAWEWTATTFGPYPGFVAGAYAEYSEPWFGTRKVLRGASFATRARIARNTYRNFFTPDRTDVPAGFRTAGDP
jgi:iron(II)-dependent oxidoreductase